jgi:hypothetical protein
VNHIVAVLGPCERRPSGIEHVVAYSTKFNPVFCWKARGVRPLVDGACPDTAGLKPRVPPQAASADAHAVASTARTARLPSPERIAIGWPFFTDEITDDLFSVGLPLREHVAPACAVPTIAPSLLIP